VNGPEYVFGYGSLVASRGGHVTELRDHERRWGVAMDNARDLPGYKYYVAPDGTRPAVFVAFLDVAPAAGASVSGVCTPVAADLLAGLDARERNYERRDVTALVGDPPGRTWAYVGSPAGRERFAQGSAAACCVVAEDYLRLVRDGFSLLGADAYDRAVASLDPGDLPVRALRRVDL
jgi:dephospho-CoA kinase